MLLEAFEPEGVAAAESLAERLEASRVRLVACNRGAAKDAVQHTLGLVNTHLLEADLDPVGDSVPEDCSNAESEANHYRHPGDRRARHGRAVGCRSPGVCFICFAARKVG